MEIEVKVGALIMDPQSGTPIVVLRGVSDESVLPIWVGTYEAHAIALEIEKSVPQRPMTHDLIRNLIVEMGAVIERVVITELRDSTFYAVIELSSTVSQNTQKGGLTVIDARPSDAIALALRFSSPIWVKKSVIESAGASVSASDTDDASIDEDELAANEEWPEVIDADQ
ncbi:MAG: bifunctional nuclease family protein [Pyrinomonadaceae bacterium]|nr:bifunctional nuclease family protein [Pyrinomonadaceae bacterium]